MPEVIKIGKLSRITKESILKWQKILRDTD